MKSSDSQRLCRCVERRYATDPDYSYILKWVMQTYGFFRYDC